MSSISMSWELFLWWILYFYFKAIDNTFYKVNNFMNWTSCHEGMSLVIGDSYCLPCILIWDLYFINLLNKTSFDFTACQQYHLSLTSSIVLTSWAIANSPSMTVLALFLSTSSLCSSVFNLLKTAINDFNYI